MVDVDEELASGRLTPQAGRRASPDEGFSSLDENDEAAANEAGGPGRPTMAEEAGRPVLEALSDLYLSEFAGGLMEVRQ